MAPFGIPPPILRLRVTRREALQLAGLATGMLVTACGGSGSSSPPSGPVTTRLDGGSVPSSEQITGDVIGAAAEGYNGGWHSTWRRPPRSGTISGSSHIDVAKRTASARLRISPGFLADDAPAVDETFIVALSGFPYEKPPYHADTASFGPVTLDLPHQEDVVLTARAVPGQPDLSLVTFHGILSGPGLVMQGGTASFPWALQVHRKDGSVASMQGLFTQTQA
jgi:hypothetical protein